MNVTASTWPAATCPVRTRCAIRWVIVRVLPVPAPASTQTGPARCLDGGPLVVVQAGGRGTVTAHGGHPDILTPSADGPPIKPAYAKERFQVPD